MSIPEQNGPKSGSARSFLLVLGIFFAALAIACLAFPSWNVPGHAMPVCAMLAVGLIAIARFLPDRWVRRIESVLLGWP